MNTAIWQTALRLMKMIGRVYTACRYCRWETDGYYVKTSILLFDAYDAGNFPKPVILLLDEYDVPLAKASANGYYPQMLELMKSS